MPNNPIELFFIIELNSIKNLYYKLKNKKIIIK